MSYNFYKSLINGKDIKDMPPVNISIRNTDKYITYQREKMRLDYIAGQIYKDETLWRVIMWANPEYSIEFDIPNQTVIRIPFPINDVLTEVNNFIINNKDK